MITFFFAVMYFNLLGLIQLFGLHIDVFVYITVSISVGLMIDYTIHVLLHYMECDGSTREIKVKKTLRSIGASILQGAMSTLLGVIPLAFSTSQGMRTLFLSFFAVIVIGVTHGLVFLPVALSYFGPLDTSSSSASDDDRTTSTKKPCINDFTISNSRTSSFTSL